MWPGLWRESEVTKPYPHEYRDSFHDKNPGAEPGHITRQQD